MALTVRQNKCMSTNIHRTFVNIYLCVYYVLFFFHLTHPNRLQQTKFSGLNGYF